MKHNNSTSPKKLTDKELRDRRLWVAENRKALTEVAETCGVSPQFVHMVLYGRRKSGDGKVERELKKMGAPI